MAQHRLGGTTPDPDRGDRVRLRRARTRRVAERTTVCPAGTAPHDVSGLAQRPTPLRRYPKRREWINAGKLGASERRWSTQRVERELRAFTRDMDQWPAHEEFVKHDRQRLYCQIAAQGGEPVWAYRIGLPIAPGIASPREWTDERVRAGLALYLENKAAWPTQAQFTRDGLRALSEAITRRGAAPAGQRNSRCPTRKPTRAADTEPGPINASGSRSPHSAPIATPSPARRELRQVNAGGLLRAIDTHHGLRWWADQFGLQPAKSGSIATRTDAMTEPQHPRST